MTPDLVSMRQSTVTFGRISWCFFVKVVSNPEVDSLFALKVATFSMSPLYLAVTRPGCLVSWRAFWRISRIFYVKANSHPEVLSARTQRWSYGGGGRSPFYWHFSHSVQLDAECPPCRYFFEPSMANSFRQEHLTRHFSPAQCAQ